MFAAFHIADLPVTAALRVQPALRDRPCAILRDRTKGKDGKIPLLSINFAARLTGIAPGWQLGRALVRCPNLAVISRSPEEETALLAELVELADRFSADVEITSADTVLLDLSGTKRMHFDGLESLPKSEVEVSHALAETPDLAHFAVLEPGMRGRFISVSELGTMPLSLVEKLGGEAKLLSLLELLGLSTLEDFRRLPRQGLTERFGPQAGHWHDVISGKSCRLLKLHRPPESFLQQMDFDDAIHSGEALLFVFNRLLHVLASRLAARHLAASVLEIRLRLIEGAIKRQIHLPEPLSDPTALLKPIQTLVDSLVLPSPVIGVELDASAAFPLSSQNDWTRRKLANPERWADTLARLEALVGTGHVGIPLPLEVLRPDAFELREATGNAPALENERLPDCSVPLRRFRPPVKISVASDAAPGVHPRPLALLTGPHCGPVREWRGPFPLSGETWEPGNAWQRLEWDVWVDRSPPLRLVFQPEDHWQLDGAYF